MKKLYFALCICFLCFSFTNKSIHEKPKNILLIVADDLGYADLGCFGSEIKTPNLDKLAKEGIINTAFYAGATCSPTRAMLLSGVDNHRNGMGTMEGDWDTNQKGKRGYEGYLNFDIVPFPELLQNNGYHTSIAGKWHLAFPASNEALYPDKRGFTRSFSLLAGGASHFSDKKGLFKGANPKYSEDGKLLNELPKDFYSTTFYTDKTIGYINESMEQKKPFFSYLAYTAPHWPLQVPDNYIDLYKGKYDDGYEVLAQKRFENMKKLGIIPTNAQAPDLLPNIKPWKLLTETERKQSAKVMEIYAAMVEMLDENIGRVIQHLKNIGEYDNTLILFMADNGAEGNALHHYEDTGEWIKATFDNSLENMGKLNSYIYQGSAWAHASVTPFRWYKAFSTEGGVRCPMIISGGKQFIKNIGSINRQFISVMDIAPSILELTNTNYPKKTYKNKEIYPLDGTSFLSFLKGESTEIHPKNKPFAWELYGRRAVKLGDWRAIYVESPYGKDDWELYNLENDISQEHDLSKENPKQLQKMKKIWAKYEKKYGVVLPKNKVAYGIEPNFENYNHK